VRALFGGKIRECVTGAAPIAPEILRFFYACGVPVMEGYGMTETSTSATVNRPTGNNFRFGSVGRPQEGVEVKIADDGEVLIKGPNIFQGYYKNEEATSEALEDRWLHTGDLGRLDEDGFLYITGRKKDIIITAGGKNITPANLENGLKQTRWISQAVVIGDRRPYLIALITLDPEEAPALAEQLGLDDASLPALAQNEAVREEIQKAIDEVNSHVGPVEQIKRFEILDHDLSQETGELTPTLKVKRNVVHEKFADLVDQVYAAAR
jgi:long-chain acyl-CoA synthetase